MSNPSNPLKLLGDVSPEQFLQEHWQKKPLLIKGALTELENPLAIEEVAGLACEDFIESRLVTQSEQAPFWQLQHGPLTDDDFLSLPEQGWTLHIQGVDKWIPEIYQLLDLCNFLPNWRVDDIMISASTDTGSAGPHYDQYDVFLIQTEGNKRWRLGQQCDSNSALLPDCDLQILQDFETTDEFVAEPGDVLYIPPGVAHYGISEGSSITYSIGFRAPAHHELLTAFANHVADQWSEHERYSDPELTLPKAAGELTPAALAKVKDILTSALDDPQTLQDWFGQYITDTQQEDQQQVEPEAISWQELEPEIAAAEALCWAEGSRFSFLQSPDKVTAFVNGERFQLAIEDSEAIAALFSQRSHSLTTILELFTSDRSRKLLSDWLSCGLLYLLDD